MPILSTLIIGTIFGYLLWFVINYIITEVYFRQHSKIYNKIKDNYQIIKISDNNKHYYNIKELRYSNNISKTYWFQYYKPFKYKFDIILFKRDIIYHEIKKQFHN